MIGIEMYLGIRYVHIFAKLDGIRRSVEKISLKPVYRLDIESYTFIARVSGDFLEICNSPVPFLLCPRCSCAS